MHFFILKKIKQSDLYALMWGNLQILGEKSIMVCISFLDNLLFPIFLVSNFKYKFSDSVLAKSRDIASFCKKESG